MLNSPESVLMGNPINDFLESLTISPKISPKTPKTMPSLNHAWKSLDSLEQIKTSLKDLPEMDKERILFLKAQIQEGSYQIDSNQIAQRMINLENA